MKTYRVDHRELERGTKIEMKEHPTMSERTARRTARQQLVVHPTFYQVMPLAEKIMADRERNIKPKKRNPIQRAYNPLYDGVPPIPKRLW